MGIIVYSGLYWGPFISGNYHIPRKMDSIMWDAL